MTNPIESLSGISQEEIERVAYAIYSQDPDFYMGESNISKTKRLFPVSLASAAPHIQELCTKQAQAAIKILREVNRDYEAAMYEISEIVRVARDNPGNLKEFLMLNYPKEWGLTKMQHKALLSGGKDV